MQDYLLSNESLWLPWRVKPGHLRLERWVGLGKDISQHQDPGNACLLLRRSKLIEENAQLVENFLDPGSNIGALGGFQTERVSTAMSTALRGISSRETERLQVRHYSC